MKRGRAEQIMIEVHEEILRDLTDEGIAAAYRSVLVELYDIDDEEMLRGLYKMIAIAVAFGVQVGQSTNQADELSGMLN